MVTEGGTRRMVDDFWDDQGDGGWGGNEGEGGWTGMPSCKLAVVSSNRDFVGSLIPGRVWSYSGLRVRQT